MDIAKLTTKELQALLQRIPKEINKRKGLEKAKLMDDIAQIASKHGYSLSELIGKAPRPRVKGKKARKRKPVAVKYRHPEQANLTWTGRGRKPHWVSEWLAEGKTMEKLAV
jgi:DNA-binding protein H-NS